MVSITSWMYLIIPGFIYLTAAFFLYLIFAKINHINITDNVRPLFPYIAIAVIFISHILGFSIHSASQRIFYWILPGKNFISLTNENIPEKLLEIVSQSYAGLVMIRHVGISTIILGITFFWWSGKNISKRLKGYYFISLFLLIIVFVLTYLFQRELLNQLNIELSLYS